MSNVSATQLEEFNDSGSKKGSSNAPSRVTKRDPITRSLGYLRGLPALATRSHGWRYSPRSKYDA